MTIYLFNLKAALKSTLKLLCTVDQALASVLIKTSQHFDSAGFKQPKMYIENKL
jgi:hypothetical protein